MKRVIIKKRVRVSNPKRFMFSIMSLLILTGLMINITLKPRAAESNSAAIQEEKAYKIYIVKSDENLWSIANKYTNDESDTAQLVKEIMKENKLNNSTIHKGLTLKIPISK